jgi:ferredoxin-NADP reductase
MVNNAEFGSYLEPLIQQFRPYWSTTGYRARVVKLIDESPRVFSITLKPAKGWSGFSAGQFIEIYTEQDGRRLTRCFSISSSPSSFKIDGTITLTIRVQDRGRVTPQLRTNLQAGDFIGLSKAQGDFTLSKTPRARLLIAGGSGITPFRSMLGEISQEADAQHTTLLYYSGHKGSHLFEQKFRELAQAHSHINVKFLETKRDGRPNIQHLLEHCPDFSQRDIYICGPTGMIQAARNMCTQAGTPAAQIHFEYFGAAPIESTALDTQGLVVFNKSGKSATSQASQPQSILSLAETSGLNPKSGCKMGLCGQCQCTKTSGVVYNTKTGLRSDTGKESIKLCISVPVGDVAVEL